MELLEIRESEERGKLHHGGGTCHHAECWSFHRNSKSGSSTNTLQEGNARWKRNLQIEIDLSDRPHPVVLKSASKISRSREEMMSYHEGTDG